MRQKPGTLRPPTTPETPGTSTARPASQDRPMDTDGRLPGRVRTDSSLPSPDMAARSPHSTNARVEEPAIAISRIPETQAPARATATSSLEPYSLSIDGALSHTADGLREYKGRKFADLATADGSATGQTVMVAYHDLIKAYRARLPSERVPSGPPLYRVGESNVWSLEKPVEYYDPSKYRSSSSADARGYYAISEYKDIERSGPYLFGPKRIVVKSDAGFAFKDEKQRLVRVDPDEARGDTSIPVQLAHWSDGEIWWVYRLEGARSLAFRVEAAALGRAPDWATRFREPNIRTYLLESLRWPWPHKSESERSAILRSYNLSIAQQERLRPDMAHGEFPEWAEQHKRLTQDIQDTRRFEQIAEELGPFSLDLRKKGESHEWGLPKVNQRYEASFLENYLEYAGYKRNKHDYLYRTDIPAMFRADLRTPFELARDKRLVKLRGNPSDSTTKSPLSATFLLKNGLWYMGFDYYSNPRHYNTQANRYPGHFSDSDSSSGYRHSSGEESATSFEMDNSRDYPLRRREQSLGFLYVIDTRGIEVVPRVENIYLNNRDFDGDAFEGRISMPTRGISAERIWLVSSDMRQAARVEDIFSRAGSEAGEIEEATWAGHRNSNAYDRLIDQVAHSGGVILKLPMGENTSSNDIAWPVAEHHRP
ncbi:hypothetical protein [Pseudomonas moraviensis]|uniref:hypothetical protein n=1 Tax=Pseudomonas moraviensis TaxID=321662 RepID=UPI001059C8E7|nr:hypothetical protein [Pseudomonas moraviensis]TDK53222.1 hypothetical protein E1508_20035 [Pseudomonas moraviensis]